MTVATQIRRPGETGSHAHNKPIYMCSWNTEGEHMYMNSYLYVLQHLATTNDWTYRRRKVTFWRRNLCCIPFHYYLLNCEKKCKLSRIYESPKNGRKIQLSWNFICKSLLYFTRFNSRVFQQSLFQTVYFLPGKKLTLRAFHNHLFIDYQEKKGQFLLIFKIF